MITIIEYIFDLPLDYSDIYAWRGAMGAYALKAYKAKKITAELASHFTNHDVETGKLIERYAHIQYRSMDGRAVIWAINEGVEALKCLIEKNQIAHFEMNGRMNISLSIAHTYERSIPIPEISKSENEYRIDHFIPFNEEKYEGYKKAKMYIDKIKLIEEVLLNEIVLWAQIFQVPNIKELKIKSFISDIPHKSIVTFKTKTKDGKLLELGLHSFGLRIFTNLMLPDSISLGRHKGYGYGVVSRVD